MTLPERSAIVLIKADVILRWMVRKVNLVSMTLLLWTLNHGSLFLTVVKFEEVESALRNPCLIIWDTATDGVHVVAVALSKVDPLPPALQPSQAQVNSPAAHAKDTCALYAYLNKVQWWDKELLVQTERGAV